MGGLSHVTERYSTVSTPPTLPGRSRGLTRYEAFSIDAIRLAGFRRPASPRGQGLGTLSRSTGEVFAFLISSAGFEPATDGYETVALSTELIRNPLRRACPNHSIPLSGDRI